jgi:hypothetical protein
MSTSNNPPGDRDNQGDPNRPMPVPPQGRDKNGLHYTPWLVVRYQGGDDGSRPLPPPTVFWESPDVWTQGSMGINMPVVNEPTQVFARVTNLGLEDAIGATIQYWWANPSIAITEATATPIGTLTGVTIPAQNSLVFQSPTDWVPIEVNFGHECLIVQAFVPVFDPLTVPMQPLADRHVGQKNEWLVTVAPSMMFHFALEARNFTTEDQEVEVAIRRGIIPRNFEKRFGRPGLLPAELLDPSGTIPLQIDIGAKPIATAPPSIASRALIPPRPGMDCLGPALVSATQLFRHGEVRRVVVAGALPPSAAPGEIYVFRITQSIAQKVVGGYTLYVTLAPGKLR